MLNLAKVIQYEGDNSTFVWKHPKVNFNNLTQLIVHESQEAIFFMNGQALDLFGPGRHTLNTQNLPMVTKMLKLGVGGSPFHCEVYFINKTVQMAIKWGTDSKVRFLDPQLGFPVEIGASGEMNLMVSDSRKLLVKLVGTMHGVAWEERTKEGFTKSLQAAFRPLISTAVKTHLGSSIKEQNINLLEVDSNLEQLSEMLRKHIAPGFEEYGLTIPQFYITNIVLPEDENFRKMRDLHSVALRTRMEEASAAVRVAHVDAEAAVSTAEAEAAATVAAAMRKAEMEKQITQTEIARQAAERELLKAQTDAQKIRLSGLAEAEVMQAKGYSHRDELQADVQKAYAEGIGNMGANGGGNGVVGEFVSLGVGMAAAGTVATKMGDMFKGATGEESAAAAENLACPQCGKKLPANAKFCLECGAKVEKLAANEMLCPVCGKKTPKGKFCMECGAALVKKCPKCGSEVPEGGKFCLECGEKL